MRYLFVFALSLVLFTVSWSQELELDYVNNHAHDHSLSHEFDLDMNLLQESLKSAPTKNATKESWSTITLPLPSGKSIQMRAAEASIFTPKMQKLYPGLRSYIVKSVDDQYISGRIAISHLGLSGLIYTEEGQVYYEKSSNEMYKVYKSVEKKKFDCGAIEDKGFQDRIAHNGQRDSYGGEELTYRIAVASSAEFSAKHGNNLATINAKINEYLTALNAIYERDLSINFILANNNNNIIFFDPVTDGLDNNNRLPSAFATIPSNMNSGDYDIGHVFHELPAPQGGWSGSGIAALGVVCKNGNNLYQHRASGWSSCGGPYPLDFWMDIFAHEVGHQFAATHSFYGTSNFCGGSQRSTGNGVEPGSGNSLMSYEGVCQANGGCSDQNISPTSGYLYFHGHSIEQVRAYIDGSGSCGQSNSLSNSAPVITMPSNTTIPKGTSFSLSATASDPDGDPLLLGWEEVDTDNLVLSCPDGAPNDAATSTTAPLFRSFDPSDSGGTRHFPALNDQTDNTQTMGEILPQVARDINMRFTARSEALGGVSFEDMIVTVADSGPFEVTTANTSTGYLGGEQVTLTWNVANTNQAPVSCSNVDILFSTNGGLTFPITLLENTPNDGSQLVTLPNSGTMEGRFKVQASNNIFYDMNNADIVISSDCNTGPSEIYNDEDVVADAGDPALDLGLTLGSTLTSFAGTLNNEDNRTNLLGKNASGTCITFSNLPLYESVTVIVEDTDTYTFSTSASYPEVVNIHEDFLNTSNDCANLLGTNFSYINQNISFENPYSLALTAGETVEIVLTGFNNPDAGNFSMNISSANGGSLIQETQIPNGYNYRYVVYNSSDIITDIESSADLSDDSQYQGGNYTVVGMMVFGNPDLSSYVGQTFASLQSDINTGSQCGQFSSNDVSVTINACVPGTKMVTSPADSGPGTLRYEIDNACPTDMILFSSSLNGSTINFASEVVISKNMTVNGLGVNNLSFSGGNSNRLFNVQSGNTLDIKNLTLKDGYALTNGGAFINQGTVKLSNIELRNNKTGTLSDAFTNNGSIVVDEGTVEIKD